MDKIWIVFLFLIVMLAGNRAVKYFIIRKMSSEAAGNDAFVPSEEKEDPKIFWEKEGFRREPQQADYILPEEDFFENEKTEFPESFPDELKGISEAEAKAILLESGIYRKEGEL